VALAAGAIRPPTTSPFRWGVLAALGSRVCSLALKVFLDDARHRRTIWGSHPIIAIFSTENSRCCLGARRTFHRRTRGS